MLNIFADALLIAARGAAVPPAQSRRKAEPETEQKARRRWFSLVGMRA